MHYKNLALNCLADSEYTVQLSQGALLKATIQQGDRTCKLLSVIKQHAAEVCF